MIEGYETWEDDIRRTFIELADFQMKQHSDPIEFAIDFAWSNGCDLFTINNAKHELKVLKEQYIPASNEAIDRLLSLCESAISTGKWHLTPSILLDAKANLHNLRQSKKDLAKDAYQANLFAIEEMNRNL